MFSLDKHEKQISLLERKQDEESQERDEVLKKINDLVAERDKHYNLQNKLFKADLDTVKFEIKTLIERKEM